MNTTGNSRPFALWTVSTATASASGSRSAVGGSSPASISVWRWRATNAPGRRRGATTGPDDVEEPGDVPELLLGARPSRSPRAGRAPRRPAGTRRAPRRPAARGRARSSAAGRRRAGRRAVRVAGAITRRMPGCRSSSSRTSQTRPVAAPGACSRSRSGPRRRGGTARPSRPRRRRRSSPRSATARRNASRRRTSGRAYRPDVPENRHGMPATLRLRRIGSAWPFARTRTAMVARARPGRDAPADLGGDPVRLLAVRRECVSSRTGRLVGGRRALGDEPLRDPGLDLEPVRVVEADEAVDGVEDRRRASGSSGAGRRSGAER